jgi:hypothetical protein
VWGQAPANNSENLDQLQQRIAHQEEEIKKLQDSLAEQKALLDQAIKQAAAPQATPTAQPADQTATSNPPSDPAKMVPVDLKRTANGRSAAGHPEGQPSPLSISIGNTTFTPLGFVDATYFFRSANIGSGIGTNFGAVPFNTAPNGHLSENSLSAQNSRIGMRIDSDLLGWKVLGYLEADFLFNNNANSFQITSNSAGMRLRNYFVDVNNGKFEFLGGQDWSMLTPNRKGLSPLPSDIFYTQNEDTNYQVGLTWTRAAQFRFILHPSHNFAIGLALENPQQYIGGGNGSSQSTLPTFLAGQSSFINQFQYSEALGAGSSITQVPNGSPDFILKAALDGNPGGHHALHLEVAGVASEYKDYIPGTSTFTANKYVVVGSHSTGAFGGSINSNLEIFKNFRVVENAFYSDGVGRYIFGQAPDVVLLPTGGISAIHAASTVDGFEAQVSPKTLFGAYYGGVFIGKDVVFDPTGTKPGYVGYGYKGSTQNRAIQEVTFDWVQTLWKNKNYGALSLINQYSYLLRQPWNLGASAPNRPHDNIVYINVRYTLP